jgi:uncharacterized membrane protein YphA (DoxX/SURF4 family)
MAGKSKESDRKKSAGAADISRQGWRESGAWRSLALRFIVVAAQATTILITAPLWLVRHYPPQSPLLPAFGLSADGWPQFNVLPWLLGSLVLVLVLPRIGIVLHCLLLAAAMVLDQTRIQPECVSLAVLMIGSLESPGAMFIGRSSLIAMWFWAGLHKLLSPGYFHAVVPFLTSGLFAKPSTSTYLILGATAAGVELLLGLLAIFRRLRRAVAVVGCAMHLTIAFWLAFHLGWNASVWPWNIALSAAAILLIWPWRTRLIDDWRGISRLAKVAAAVILISPLGFYFNLLDGYLAYCMYAGNTPEAKIVLPDGAEVRLDTVASSLNAPLPPAIRIYEEYFDKAGLPGELLEIHDPRWLSRWRGNEYREIRKEGPSVPRQ